MCSLRLETMRNFARAAVRGCETIQSADDNDRGLSSLASSPALDDTAKTGTVRTGDVQDEIIVGRTTGNDGELRLATATSGAGLAESDESGSGRYVTSRFPPNWNRTPPSPPQTGGWAGY